jgi:hypothetical protein
VPSQRLTRTNPQVRHLKYWLVEVAGVEPASFSFLMGLLRAQPVEGLEARPATGVRASLQPTKLSPSDCQRHRSSKPHKMTPATDPWGWGRTDVAVI